MPDAARRRAACRRSGPEHGTDRLALEGAGGGAADLALGRRDAEMVGPERNQPLDEADRRGAGLLEARLCVGPKELLLGARLVHHRAGRGGHARRRRGIEVCGDVRRRHGVRREAHRLEAVAFLVAPKVVVEHRLEDLRRPFRSARSSRAASGAASSSSSAWRGSPDRVTAPGRAPRPKRLKARDHAWSAVDMGSLRSFAPQQVPLSLATLTER